MKGEKPTADGGSKRSGGEAVFSSFFVDCHFQGLFFNPTIQKTVTCHGTQKHQDHLSFAACGKHRLLLGLVAKCGYRACGPTIGTI